MGLIFQIKYFRYQRLVLFVLKKIICIKKGIPTEVQLIHYPSSWDSKEEKKSGKLKATYLLLSF